MHSSNVTNTLYLSPSIQHSKSHDFVTIMGKINVFYRQFNSIHLCTDFVPSRLMDTILFKYSDCQCRIEFRFWQPTFKTHTYRENETQFILTVHPIRLHLCTDTRTHQHFDENITSMCTKNDLCECVWHRESRDRFNSVRFGSEWNCKRTLVECVRLSLCK